MSEYEAKAGEFLAAFDVRSLLDLPSGTLTIALATVIREAVEAEREKDCRAMCDWCDSGSPVEERRDFATYWIHVGKDSRVCEAWPIRLRAQKERET